MGNSDSRETFKDGSLNLIVDHQHLMTGDKVTGTVTYKLLKPFPGEHIKVELVGKEKIMWEGSDKKNTDPKHPGKIVIKKTLLQLSKVV